MAQQSYSVRITLRDQQVKALMGDMSIVKDIDMVQSVAQEAVGKIADGGLLLTSGVVSRVEKVLGKTGDQMAIAKAVESGVSMDGDNVVVKMTMDPLWIGELREKAAATGMGLNALASELQSQLLHQGLLYDMVTERLPIYLTHEQHAAIKRKLDIPQDRPLFGSDVAKACGVTGAVELENIFSFSEA